MSGTCACNGPSVQWWMAGLTLPLEGCLAAWYQPASCRPIFATSAASALQIRDLHAHYLSVDQGGTLPRFLGSCGKQLPSLLWDTAHWIDARQLFPGKLVFLASKQDATGVQQVAVKFSQQYGVATHKAWAAEGLVPRLVAEPTKLPGG